MDSNETHKKYNMDLEKKKQRNEAETSISSDFESKPKVTPKDEKLPVAFFILEETPAPPETSTKEVLKCKDAITNMALAHEIAVNKDFKLEKLALPENTLEKKVHDILHLAYWDVLKSELAKNPPVYKQALNLLEAIRDGLVQVLLPQHTHIKQQILEVLDPALIEQQANQGTLDFKHYAQYVIATMGKLCAPIRDDKIKELNTKEDVVETFQNILETLELMKLDMANFTINTLRPHIVATSVEYEKQKFAEYLEVQKDGLEKTRSWLCRHVDNSRNEENVNKKLEIIINNAFLELLDWNLKEPLPETLIMDEKRILEIRKCFRRIIITEAIFLIICSNVDAAIVQLNDFRPKIKLVLLALLEEEDQPFEQIVVKLGADLKEYYQKYLPKNEFSDVMKNIKAQVVSVGDSSHKVVVLLKGRIEEFILGLLSSNQTLVPQVPVGLSSIETELKQMTASFLRLVSYNKSVFGEYYQLLVRQVFEPAPNGSVTL